MEPDERTPEQRYRRLFTASPDAVFLAGDDGRLVEVSRRACEITGYPECRLRGMHVADLYTEASLAQRPFAWPAADDFQVAHVDREIRRADGSTFHAEIHVRRIDAGAVLAVARDVSAHRRIEETLHRYAERLVTLHRLDQAILGVQSSQEVAQAAVESLRQFVPCERIAVLVFEDETGKPALLAAFPGVEPEVLLGINLHQLASISDALRRREIYLVRDVSMIDDEPTAPKLLEAGFRSLLVVPLVSQEQVIGLLSLFARQPDAFSVEHIDAARETSVVLSLAVQNARLFEEVTAARERLEQLSRRLVRIQEDERRHLALELHDEIGQVLTALHLSLELDDPGMADPARQRLVRAKKIVEVLTGKVRNLSLDLRPTLLDDLGLLPALLWYVRRYAEQTGVQLQFRHAGLGGRRFPVEVETAAYRIVQEALTNIARHAGVDAAAAQAWVNDDRLHLLIEDHGRGFALTDQQTASSGLSGMRERARLVGGDLVITSEPEQGVRVEAILPLGTGAEP